MAATHDRIGPADEDTVEFGPFRLDRARRLLTKHGAPITLGDRALEILLVLIRHAPEVVSKAMLFEQVWPGICIEDSTLRYHLWTLRKGLGDGEGGNRYISTASGKGYCFVAPLSRPSTAKQPATNLPLRLTDIIGRERELIELADWLKGCRLVTLGGPGGVGKTRLAVELGWRVLGEFAAGVWLIDLAPHADCDAIPSVIAATLGISVMKPEAAVDAIVTALGKAQLLLIFDNCEQLAAAAASLIKTLLERAPGVSVLATSQKSFQLAAERVYGLDPLAVPPADAVEITGFAAVELFAARARAADRRFELDDGNSAGVGAICRQLDGLPLALEMAAGRLHMLGVEGLRRGLDDRLKLLKGAPDGVARHTSLHGMLDWSHSLLSPSDQEVFRRLAVFPAGFSLEAAVAVAGGNGTERWTVVDALGRLIDRSLVTLEQREPARYRLLETLRLYAADKLRQAGETDAIAELHARHFIEVFDGAEACWEQIPDPDWLARYQPELDNLRAGLDWALAAPGRRQIALALAASGSVLLRWLPLIAEGHSYLDRLIPLLDADTPAAIAARLLNHAANFCLLLSDPKGLGLAERAAALCRDGSDRSGAVAALVTAAQYEIGQGRHAEAKEHLLEARRLLTGRTLKKSQMRLSAIFGLVSDYVNDVADARLYYLEALETARALKSRVEAAILTNLGNVEYLAGNIDHAIELMRTALDRSGSQPRYNHSGAACAILGEFLIAKGQLAEARARLEQALSILIDRGNYPSLACLQPWAGLAALEGRLPEAAQLIGFIDAERERRGQLLYPGERPLYDRLMGILEAGLPPAELAAWKAMGAEWSEAEAIRFVAGRMLVA